MAKYDEYVVNAVNMFLDHVRGIDPRTLTISAEQVDEFLVARELIEEPPPASSKEWAHHINERGKARGQMNRYAGSKARAEDGGELYQIMYAGAGGWKIELGAKAASEGMIVYFDKIRKSATNKKVVIGRLVAALEASEINPELLPLLESQLDNFDAFAEDAKRLADRALKMHDSFESAIAYVRETLELPEPTGTDEN